VVFLLPIADTTTVTVNRMLKGRSPFVGGRDHTTHHLGYAGLSDAQVAFVYTGLGLLNIFMVFCSVKFIGSWRNMHTIIYVAYAMIIAGALFALTQWSRPAEPRS
jgi:UDP-GlcNAc:undecaprenyl-phosphate GlcNAc-1-phosphate transferase